MTEIKIRERLSPFSHQPGISCMIPGSSLALQIFPALVRLYDLNQALPISLGHISLSTQGPVHDFTVVQDLEKREIRVFGRAQQGYFRYLCREEGLVVEKGALDLQFHTKAYSLIAPATKIFPPSERISLGCHKAQDWTQMQRRQDLKELLPLWFRLGSLSSAQAALSLEGTAALLEPCRNAILHSQKDVAFSSLCNLFLAGFEGLFVPHLEETQHLGFALPPLPSDSALSPILLLTEGAKLIRSLFIQYTQGTCHILPCLPSAFHAGRATGLQIPSCGELDLEWSKKEIRRLILRATEDREILFLFQKEVKEFRLQEHSEQLCERMASGQSLTIQKGKQYLLDNFKHSCK